MSVALFPCRENETDQTRVRTCRTCGCTAAWEVRVSGESNKEREAERRRLGYSTAPKLTERGK